MHATFTAGVAELSSGHQEGLVPVCYLQLSEKQGACRSKVPGDAVFKDLQELIHILIFLTYRF